MAPRDSTGKSTNKTQPTAADAAQFIDAVDTSAVRRADARALLDIMGQETGEPAVMWGPSIVGFGSYHYKYASGREGDAAAVGFSPRKAKLVIYGLTYPPGAEQLLDRLGTFKRGAGCIYLNKLADINEGVLRELIRAAYGYMTTADVQSLQSQKDK
ncbi:hypothetical protein QO003_002490 [Arthrobacter silviterrae]|uniref:DUF1801 domain-containing protein n=1 Tax=Arthrobacter silviterrae TaxID=2026658 RepID=A0ABX0DDC2_9MICC|nr:DUF1801 domain-containing protein [Arthrobacter silviterrae]MDQ0278187.1 hypothetical protein [Arthrobacter silviterrae]NGN84907.1 DUF1801 domain-containing protein [Arthrobacter silviterrae]